MDWILYGIVILALTAWNYWRAESDIVFWTTGWWNVGRSEDPGLYWTLIVGQAIAGIAAIAYGGIEIFRVWL